MAENLDDIIIYLTRATILVQNLYQYQFFWQITGSEKDWSVILKVCIDLLVLVHKFLSASEKVLKM